MTMLTNKAVLLAIKEANYGVDPGSGYIGILLNKGVSVSPGGEKIIRDIISQTYSPQGHVIGVKQTGINFEAELKGGGLDEAVIQDPEIDVLLQCCGLVQSEGLVGAVDTVAVSTFSVGETVTNTTQAAETVGVVADYVDNGDNTGTVYFRNVENDPADSDALLGGTSGTTAAVDGTRRTLFAIAQPARGDQWRALQSISTGTATAMSLRVAAALWILTLPWANIRWQNSTSQASIILQLISLCPRRPTRART